MNVKGALNYLGINIDAVGEKTVVSMEIQDYHKQPFGFVHGGMNTILIETAASVGANHLIQTGHAFGLEVNANHLKAKSEGKLVATAKCVHHGHKTQVWTVNVTDESDVLIALGRCTMFVK